MSWDIIFRLATLLGLALSVLFAQDAKDISEQLQDKTVKVQAKVEANRDTLQAHADITHHLAQLLGDLRPLFADIAQRQYVILRQMEHTQEGLETATAFHRDLQEQVLTLLAMHQRLMEQCGWRQPATPP